MKFWKKQKKFVESYITGNTRGNTTDPSAKYWYNTRVSVSSVEYFTNVANTVKTNACVDRSGNTSGSSKTFDSFDTDDRDPRSCLKIFILDDRKKSFFHWLNSSAVIKFF